MRVGQMVRQLCGRCSTVVDPRRFEAVVAVTQAIALAERLSVTSVGRAIESDTFPKHSIKRADRLLSNARMHREAPLYFRMLVENTVADRNRPIVLLDWTKVTDNFHALVAAVPADGRALAIYHEVHPEKRLGNPRVQARFLHRLSVVLPAGSRPIIVTDAGFRGPFFHEVVALGWDFVGRLRSNTKMEPLPGGGWATIPELYATATRRARKLGTFRLFRTRRRLTANLMLVGPRHYPTKHPWRLRSSGRGGLCKKTVEGAREPWLLVTSLDLPAKRIVNIYAKRMQIEETFRDTKNPRFGWCLRYVRSRSAARLNVLLLFAAIAMLAVILVGVAAEAAGIQRKFQANTETRRVLSLFVLGLELLRRPRCFPLRNVVTDGLLHLRSLQNAS